MNDVDTAWLAGLLEGEGTFTRCGTNLQVQIIMTDEDVLRRAMKIAGCGNFYERGVRKEGYKPQFQWQVNPRDDVVALLKRVRPFMGERRGARIDELLAIHEANPLKRRARKGKENHGTQYSYKFQGCRCDACVEANRAKNSEQYFRKKAKGLTRIRAAEWRDRNREKVRATNRAQDERRKKERALARGLLEG